jgi:hypothetical protein
VIFARSAYTFVKSWIEAKINVAGGNKIPVPAS